MSSAWFQGSPGVTAAVTANFKALFTHRSEMFLAQGRYIDPAKSRDPSNTTDVGVLQPGMIMGKITSSGLYAPSIYGLTGAAIANGATTVTLASTAVGTEIVRRVGATGTFKITGPPTAAGTVRTVTFTYSAISTTTATVTAVSANEVQTITMNIASTGGTLVLRVPKANGTFATTTPITWDTTDATYLASINTALDVATGVTGGIVATGAAPDTTLILTFSGTGYAGLPQPTEMVSVETLPTSSTSYSVARTTTGVDGRFVTGSIIQPVDGSETPLSLLADWNAGIKMTDDAGASVSGNVDWPNFPTGGELDCAQIVNYPADTASRTWLQQQLSTLSGGKFTFNGTGGVY